MSPKLSYSLKQMLGKPSRSVHALISRRRWESLSRYILTAEGRLEVERLGCDDENAGQTALHLACKFDPPMEVVEQLLEIFPEAIAKVNRFGQTPLHVAAPVFESAGLIRCLVEQYPAAASVIDEEGKTPLILLCEHARFDMEDKPLIFALYETAWAEVIDAALALCTAAPLTMVTVKDSTGMSALQYAIDNDADKELVTFLLGRSKQAMVIDSSMRNKEHFQRTKSKEDQRPEPGRTKIDDLNFHRTQKPLGSLSKAA